MRCDYEDDDADVVVVDVRKFAGERNASLCYLLSIIITTWTTAQVHSQRIPHSYLKIIKILSRSFLFLTG